VLARALFPALSISGCVHEQARKIGSEGSELGLDMVGGRKEYFAATVYGLDF
jgi:hypothetical protein